MTDGGGTVTVLALFEPKPGQVGAVLDALRSQIPLVHEEDGCELYAIGVESDDRIVMVEKWTSAATLDAHGAGPVVAELNRLLDGLLAGPVVVTRQVPVPIGDASKGAL